MSFTVFLAMLAVAAGSPTRETPPPPLAGTWLLAETHEIRSDGTLVQNYGADARGLLMIDRSGRYSLQIFRADRPHFVSRDKYKGTAQEYAAATTGISTHVGLVEMKPAEGLVVFRIESASFPNWEGTEQRRHYKLVGDVLSYEVPPAADGTIAQSVWHRAK